MPRRPSDLGAMLGRRIAGLRAEIQLTQEKLAWEVDIRSKGYLSRIESGERMPSLGLLIRLADRLDVEVRDLLIFPERSAVDEAMERVRRGGSLFAAQVMSLRTRDGGRALSKAAESPRSYPSASRGGSERGGPGSPSGRRRR